MEDAISNTIHILSTLRQFGTCLHLESSGWLNLEHIPASGLYKC